MDFQISLKRFQVLAQASVVDTLCLLYFFDVIYLYFVYRLYLSKT